jgi:hypothetical protein
MTDQHRVHTDHHRVPADAHRPPVEPRLDALLPSEMAAKASDIGAKKGSGRLVPTFVLAVLAGAFVSSAPRSRRPSRPAPRGCCRTGSCG